MTFDQHWLQDILCLKASSMFSENGCFALPLRKLELLKKKCFLQTPLSVNHLSFILTFVQHLTQIPSKVTRLLVSLAWVYYTQGLVFYSLEPVVRVFKVPGSIDSLCTCKTTSNLNARLQLWTIWKFPSTKFSFFCGRGMQNIYRLVKSF